MTEHEHEALDALCHCSMRIGSSGKRFRNDVDQARSANHDLKLTKRQVMFLWSLVHTYRRQISNRTLRDHAEIARRTGEMPEQIYEADAHRETPSGRTEKPVIRKKTKYDEEIERGGGRLAL